MAFYTNVYARGSKIHLTEVDDTGSRKRSVINYRPYLFVSGSNGTNTPYRTLSGRPVVKMEFENSYEAKQYIERHSDIAGFDLYGMTEWAYPFINDTYTGQIDYDSSKINRGSIDIEVDIENGYPDQEQADKELTTLTISKGKERYVFSTKDFVPHQPNITFYKGTSEADMLRKFVSVFEMIDLDVVTGWNCIPVNQSVWGNDSISPIKDIGNSLYDSTIVRRSDISHKEVYEVTLANGSKVYSSGEHRFGVRYCDDNKYTKLTVGNKTNIEEAVVECSDIMVDGKSAFVFMPTRKNTNQDADYDDRSLYMAGLIFTDGSLKSKDRPKYGYNVYQSDMNFMECLKDMGSINAVSGNSEKGFAGYVNPNVLGNAHDMIYSGGMKKLDITLLSKLSLRQFKIFLTGLLDGDGCVSVGSSISLCNYDGHIQTVAELARWNGMFVTETENHCRFIDYDFTDMKFLNKRFEKAKLKNTITRTSSQLACKTRFKPDDGGYWVRVDKVVNTGRVEEMMDIETDTHYFVSMGVKVHNCQAFDIPYLIRRIRRVLGDDWANRLSPWGVIDERNSKDAFGKETVVFSIVGRAIVDYLDLYKKFTFTTRDNYKLDTIAEVELGIKKVDYSEYGNLGNLWKLNPQLYTEYNVQDVDIVDQLETKLKLLELLYAITYDAKTNFVDSFATVRPWDVMIHNHLMAQNIVIPAQRRRNVQEDYGGGHVKEPQTGRHKWVLSFDLNSLYPSLIRHYNISPEKYMGMCDYNIDEDLILDGIPFGMDAFMREHDVTITPNRCMWSRKGQGFLAEMMATKYAERSMYKKKMLKLRDEAEAAKANGEPQSVIDKIENEALRMDMLQMAKKIQLNSAYGSLANIHNRWYMLESAAAITAAGRLTIKWTEKKINEWFNKALKTQFVDYVIYADTDSVYVKFDDIVKMNFAGKDVTDEEICDFLSDFAANKVEPFLDRIYNELSERLNAFENQMKMKREAVASRTIFVSAKGYALSVMDNEGVRYAKPKLKVTGLEAVRSSTPSACRDSLKKAIEILLMGTDEEYYDYVDDFETKFNSLPIGQISTNTSVNGISKYYHPVEKYISGTPYHVKSAILYNDYLKTNGLNKTVEEIMDGEKAGLFPLLKGNPLRSNYVMVKGDLPNELENIRPYLDYWTQFEKGFLSPLARITRVIGMTTRRVSNLTSLFEY